MRSYKFKILIFSLLGFTVVILASLSLYDTIEAGDNIFHKIFFFIFIYAVVILILMLIYRMLDKKYDDVETSRRLYFYTKPYIIKVNKKGSFINVNKAIEEKIQNYEKYQTIFDLDVENTEMDMLEELLRQTPFTCKFQSVGMEEVFIRFIPVKIRSGYYLIGQDITEEHKQFTFHRNLALYSEITNLPNKKYLKISLQDLFKDEELLKRKNSLVVFDIVGFKNINKLFGFKIGDETIRTIAKIANDSLYDYDAKLYNIELDQFAILFTDLTSYQSVIDWYDKFIINFERAIDVKGNLFTIRIKTGIFNIEYEKYNKLSINECIEYANLAHRKAKESRVVDYALYDIALGKHFSRTQLMEVDLANAVKNNEFVMYLQPQLNNKTNKIVGYEALVRWNNPKYAYESPATFLELAEKNNYIVDIGRFIINESFKIAKDLEIYDIRISINISPVQLLHTGFVYDIINAFNKYGLKEGSIAIEITETFLMESLDEIIDKLNLIRKNGIHIHLDNFGTGYSSMLYLKDLPIDGISITKEFIKDAQSDEFSRSIIDQIIKLANNLDLEVVAEGVENEQQNRILVNLGCKIVQGYYISKALPKDEAIKFMLDYNRKGV
ncbi:MAG TPA: EAL domain-containing protein [Acholeplasmataceae bacterium]|nr:EAL domain-containing protein [Acholeplasmataceae bacterium]